MIVNSPYGYQATLQVVTDGEYYVSQDSNVISIPTSGPYPDAPSLTSAPSGNNQVLLSWTT